MMPASISSESTSVQPAAGARERGARRVARHRRARVAVDDVQVRVQHGEVGDAARAEVLGEGAAPVGVREGHREPDGMLSVAYVSNSVAICPKRRRSLRTSRLRAAFFSRRRSYIAASWGVNARQGPHQCAEKYRPTYGFPFVISLNVTAVFSASFRTNASPRTSATVGGVHRNFSTTRARRGGHPS